MRNNRLRTLMDEAGLSVSRLAADIGVDTKSAERWVTLGRLPRLRHRIQIANLLSCEQFVIWPEAAVETPGSAGGELVTFYPTRRNVPVAVWKSLMASTRSEFTVHAFAATFLPDQVMDMSVELIKLADRGVRVRLLLGNPDGDAVERRSAEENATGLAGRVRLVLGYITPAISHPQVEVRLHDHTLYASLFQFDDDVLVNPHVWGSPAGNNPILHLRRQPNGPLTSSWIAGLERVWDKATPLESWPRPARADSQVTR